MKLTAPSAATVAFPVCTVFLSAATKPSALVRLVLASKVTAVLPVEAKTIVTSCPFFKAGVVTVTFLPASCMRLFTSMRIFFAGASKLSPLVSCSSTLPAFSGPLMALMLSKRLLLSVYDHSAVAAVRAVTSASGVCVKSHFVWALALSTPASAMMLKSIFFMAFYFLLNFTIRRPALST